MPIFLQWIFPFEPQKKFYLFIYIYLFWSKVKHGILISKDFQNQLIFIWPWLKKQTLNTKKKEKRRKNPKEIGTYQYVCIPMLGGYFILTITGVQNIFRVAELSVRFGGFRKKKSTQTKEPPVPDTPYNLSKPSKNSCGCCH